MKQAETRRRSWLSSNSALRIHNTSIYERCQGLLCFFFLRPGGTCGDGPERVRGPLEAPSLSTPTLRLGHRRHRRRRRRRRRGAAAARDQWPAVSGDTRSCAGQFSARPGPPRTPGAPGSGEIPLVSGTGLGKYNTILYVIRVISCMTFERTDQTSVCSYEN